MRFEAIDEDGSRLELPIKEFPKWLHNNRKKAGMSLQAVADEFDVVRQCVWSWEKGRAMPTLERLADIVKFFDNVTGDEAQVAAPKKARAGDRLKKLARAEHILGV